MGKTNKQADKQTDKWKNRFLFLPRLNLNYFTAGHFSPTSNSPSLFIITYSYIKVVWIRSSGLVKYRIGLLVREIDVCYNLFQYRLSWLINHFDFLPRLNVNYFTADYPPPPQLQSLHNYSSLQTMMVCWWEKLRFATTWVEAALSGVFLNSYVDFCIGGENVSVVSSSVQSYTYSDDLLKTGFMGSNQLQHQEL